jgi:hypothetical protein
MTSLPDSAGDPILAAAVEHAPILVATRFSFVGQSGWQGEASRDTRILFQPDRLWRRLDLFSTVTLPSLAAQTDPGFHHLILTSDQLPDWAMEELGDACLLAYGEKSRFSILAEPPGTARRPLRLFMQRTFAVPVVVQVVLDDDDGLATDFIAELRRQLAAYAAATPDLAGSLPHFISYPEGYGFVLNEDQGRVVRAEMHRHSYPYVNAGLSLVGTPAGKNIFAVDHLAAPRKYGADLVAGQPMFLRTVHDLNDSQIAPAEDWLAFPGWRQDQSLRERFPWLFAPEASWNEG